MNPYTGEVFEIGRDLLPSDVRPGASLDMAAFEKKMREVERIGRATPDEIEAMKQKALVLVSGAAAQKLSLGAREQDRRRKRRKAGRDSRKRNR